MLEFVGEEHGGFDSARSVASGAFLLDMEVHCGAYALSCYLHESELGERQYVVACAVLLHVLAHVFVEQLSVFGELHVDKVDDDDATHIAQAQLTC